VLGFIGMVIGVLQARILPGLIGFDYPLTWLIVLVAGLALGLLIGAFHGLLVAYCGIPAFIVTLGGLLFWRNASWAVTSGQTVAPVDARFRLIGGGGPDAAIGATASWIVGLIVCAAIIAALLAGRRQRKRFAFPLRPVWADTLLAALGCGGVLAFIGVVNAYPWPPALAHRYADEHGIPWPDGGLFFSHGIAIPVLIAIGVAITVNFLATRTRFGRYIYAAGGNPEAAELGGIDTRWVTTKVFMLMGALTAISAAIATARLASATNSAGTNDELYVIAATVIGGTSLAGGAGTVAGAMIGALVMASLQSGMGLLGVDTPYQSMVIGIVLVLAVFVDTLYRRKLI
jgi:D-xylose transport system permease protein